VLVDGVVGGVGAVGVGVRRVIVSGGRSDGEEVLSGGASSVDSLPQHLNTGGENIELTGWS
jgi:hypothetical protein